MPRARNATPLHDTLPGIEAVGRGDWMRMVIHAFPGSGKTSLIGSGAENGMRTLIIRSSMDLMPARIMASGAEQFVADYWEKMHEILDFLRMSNHGYDWVWWDCVSIAQDVLLDDIWAAVLMQRPDRAALTPQGGLDRGEYGRNMERIQQWVRHMVGCNSFHFGIMAHPMEGQHPTNDEGGFVLKPYIQGKQMTEKICGYANMVGFLEIKEDKDDNPFRRLHFRESSRWYAKDQYDAFPSGYIDNPTLPAIAKAVERSRGRKLGEPSGRGRKAATPTTTRRRGTRAAA